MSAAEIIEQLRALPTDERRKVVEMIWDEFADHDLGLSAAHATELDRRLAELEARPEEGIPWEEVKAAIEARHSPLPPEPLTP